MIKGQDIIRISNSKEDFVREIFLAMKETHKKIVDKRIDFAKKNSWNNRLKTVSYLIEHYLGNKNRSMHSVLL